MPSFNHKLPEISRLATRALQRGIRRAVECGVEMSIGAIAPDNLFLASLKAVFQDRIRSIPIPSARVSQPGQLLVVCRDDFFASEHAQDSRLILRIDHRNLVDIFLSKAA